MKRKHEKTMNRLLNGELDQSEAARLRAELGDDQQARSELAAHEQLSEALGMLPTHEPGKDLHAEIMKKLAEGATPAGSPSRRFGLRPRLAWTAGGLVLGALVMYLVAPWVFVPERETKIVVTERQSICRLRSAGGEVLRSAGHKTGPLQVGERLHIGDVVRTGVGGLAEIDIDHDARLILYGDSGIEVSQLADLVRTFGLRDGRVMVELLNGGKRAVRIRPLYGKTLAEGRRGAYVALVQPDGRVAFATLRNSTLISTTRGDFTLASGQMLKLDRDGRPGEAEPIGESVALEILEPRNRRWSPGPLVVSGTTDTHARVWINGKQVAVDAQGGFRTQLPVSKGGFIQVRAEDLVGNSRRIELGPFLAVAKVEMDQTPPDRKVETKSYKVTW